MSCPKYDFAIVGGGCIAVSCARTLATKGRVIMFEGQQRATASTDYSKIVRTQYNDPDVASLAAQAKKAWETEGLYREYYNRPGWIQVLDSADSRLHLLGPQDRGLDETQFMQIIQSNEKPKLESTEQLWLNEDVGLVRAAEVLEAVAKDAAEQGVKRIKLDVEKLLVHQSRCLGVEVANEVHYYAKTTIIAAGAWTPSLLEKSGIDLRGKIDEGFFNPTAVGVAMLNLSDTEYERFKSMPILVTKIGEIMPPITSRRALKITSTKTVRVDSPLVAAPENWEDVLKVNRSVLEILLPEMKGREIEGWICHDLITPFQHPVLDSLPGIGDAYIVTGGSYHGFKFLPIWGSLVSDYLEGKAPAVIARWGWHRNAAETSLHGNIVPKDCP